MAVQSFLGEVWEYVDDRRPINVYVRCVPHFCHDGVFILKVVQATYDVPGVGLS